MEAIEEKVDDEQMKYLKDIRESQTIIDEVVVKTSDDVALLKKQKEENNDASKLLESKIETLNKEIQMRGMEPNPNKVYVNHTERKDYTNSDSGDGGPRSRVCARLTLRSAPHQN